MSTPLMPGATLGLIGGGQLARMTALAARSMGYRICVLDPDPGCAARGVVDEVVVGAFEDPDAAARLARKCGVVSYEIERPTPQALEAAARHAPLRPGPAVLACIQDRGRQKAWLQDQGYPVGPWCAVSGAEELRTALRQFGPCRVKRRTGGYDGRSQARAVVPGDAERVWNQLAAPSVAEQEVSLHLELSCLVARSPRGQVMAHPPALNVHRDGTLVHALLPAPVPAGLIREATALACALAEDLKLEGLLATEFFVTSQGKLLVNELSPRPHNTFHAAEASCGISQFEQYVRALCDLPLGIPEPRGATLLVNLLGDLWSPAPPDWEGLLALPGVSLHLYDKTPRPRRKVGHAVAWGSDTDEAAARGTAVIQALGLGTTLASAS